MLFFYKAIYLSVFIGSKFDNMFVGYSETDAVIDDDGNKDRFWRRCCGTVAVIGVIVAVLVIVGSVLSTQNG